MRVQTSFKSLTVNIFIIYWRQRLGYFVCFRLFTQNNHNSLLLCRSPCCFSAATVSFNEAVICTWLYLCHLPPPPCLCVWWANGGTDPAGETCWKSSFRLLSPLYNPPSSCPLLPLFFLSFLPSFYLTDVFCLQVFKVCSWSNTLWQSQVSVCIKP